MYFITNLSYYRKEKFVMISSLDSHWMQKARTLTQALLISGTLNIGLICSFIYVLLQDKEAVVSSDVSQGPSTKKTFTNEQVLLAYSRASFHELLLKLENQEAAEEGFNKRDLALSCLFAFYSFDVERALGGIALQKRVVSFHEEGKGQIDLLAFTGLSEEHFAALLHFAKTERWPFTPKGLFLQMQTSAPPLDPFLIEAFCLTPEFHAVELLFQKHVPTLQRSFLLSLVKEGSWERLKKYADLLRSSQCYDIEAVREFLVNFSLEGHSRLASFLLLEKEKEFVLKKFTDAQLLSFFDLNKDHKDRVERFAKEVLISPRSDLVRQKAASVLYAGVQELMPQPFDYQAALSRFMQVGLPVVTAMPSAVKAAPSVEKKIVYKVQPGDSLWKIARKHKVSVESIMKANQLQSDRLKLGKELVIPASS